MAEDRELRDALETVQGEVRALRVALAHPQDASVLVPLEHAREALQAQLRQVHGELMELEAQRQKRSQAFAAEALELAAEQARQETLIEALIESLDPGLPEKLADRIEWIS